MTNPALVRPHHETSAELRRTVAFLTRLFPDPGFDIRLWDGSVLPGSGSAGLTLVIHEPGSLRRMLRPPVELSLGEAFLRGDFDLEGDVRRVGPALEAARQSARSPSSGSATPAWHRWRRSASSITAIWRTKPSTRSPASGCSSM